MESKASRFIPELLTELCKQLSQEHFDDEVESMHMHALRTKAARSPVRHPLAGVGRVNRHWHATVQKYLFRTITIRAASTTRRLVRTLSNNPNLSYLIKTVNIDYNYGCIPTQPKLAAKEKSLRTRAAKETWELLCLLPTCVIMHSAVSRWAELNGISNMHHFGIALECLRRLSPDETVPPCMTGLRSLSVSGQLGPQLLQSWLDVAVATLERIRLSPSYAILLAKQPAAKRGQLKAISLTTGGWTDGDTFALLTTPKSSHGLQDLSFSNLGVPSAVLGRQLRGLAPSLLRLHITMSRRFPGLDEEVSGALRDALPHCCQLRVLQAIGQTEQLCTVAAALPESVRDVYFCTESYSRHGDNEYSYLTDPVTAVLDKGLPHLATMTLASPSFRYDARRFPPEAREETIARARVANVHLQYTGECRRELPWYSDH